MSPNGFKASMATNERMCRFKRLITGALEVAAPHVRVVPTHDISHLPDVIAEIFDDGIHFGDGFKVRAWGSDIQLLLHRESHFCKSQDFC